MNPIDREEPSNERFARTMEYSVAVLLTIAAIALHVRYFLDAGGLWRDEVTSVNIANTNPLSRAIANLHNDSFPIAWLLVVRFWERCGIGVSDRGMRTLGLLAGLSILAVLWRNARRFGQTAPFVSLALVGFTSAVICYGDSIRAYGLGMFLGLLAAGLIWEMTRKQTFWTFLAALIAALLSVHILYFNCVLLLAACCGAFAVMLPKGRWMPSGRVLMLALICAGSMLVYVPVVQNRHDIRILQTPLNLPTLIQSAQQSVEYLPDGHVDPGFGAFCWSLTIAAAVYLVPVRLFFRSYHGLSPRQRDAIIFCSTYLVVGALAYVAFLKVLSYSPQPWYYLAAMAMVATALDGLFAGVGSPIVRVLLAVCAAGFALNAALPVWKNVGVRRTNIDLIAARIQQQAVKGDIVVMAPWNIGVTFLRYYHGPAEVIAIPPVSSLAFQQYNLLLKFMTDRNAMDPLIRDLSDVLRSGHRVWVVGDHDFPTFPPDPPFFQKSPDPVYGWLVGNYEFTWRDEVFYALRHNSRDVRLLPIPTDRPVSLYEKASLSVVEGWKDRSAAMNRQAN
jgi:hypothetical protein